MMLLRAGQRMLHVPGIGITTSRRAVSAGGEGNWWEAGGATGCLAAYQPKGAASLAASYSNLANPGTYDAAPGVAPTFDATNGWKFARASSQWLETGITPVNNQTWSGIVAFTNMTGGSSDNTGCLFGLVQSCRFAITQQFPPEGNAHVYQSGSYRVINATTASGVYAVAGNQGYKNGLADGATIPSAAGTFTGTIAVGQTKESGYEYYLDGYIQALAIYSATLTAPQVAAVSSAMSLL